MTNDPSGDYVLVEVNDRSKHSSSILLTQSDMNVTSSPILLIGIPGSFLLHYRCDSAQV